MSGGCPLCEGDGGHLVVRTPLFRVVRVLDEPAHPAFYRVVWARHVAEFSDLAAAERQVCMDAVVEVEQALRTLLAPAKVNLASLGNVVPHLHWHVIARFADDSHFPAPIWAGPLRAPAAGRALPLESVDAAIAAALSR